MDLLNTLCRLSVRLQLITILLISQTMSKGIFELKLQSFQNDLARAAKGLCCGQSPDELKTSECSSNCSTFFRICLKQYQNTIDPEPPCTYGSKITEIVGGNSIDFATLKEFDEPLRFPFNFSWPGTFSLIVEAWHNGPSPLVQTTTDGSTDSGPKQLIMRLAEQKVLAMGTDWTEESRTAESGVALKLHFRVVCDDLYFGPQCSRYCRAKNDESGHYGCSANGTHQCLPGWTGESCDQAICLPGCHPQHGSCEKPGECVCRLGYIGDKCDQCQKYPGCKRGTCEKSFECNCEEGWGGLFCNQDLNYCTHYKPCLNDARCTNTGQGHYTCTCADGFTGTNCEMKIEDCSQLPCQNSGTCRQEQKTNYTCSCPEGFSGRHCQISAKSCRETPCDHSGTCVDTADGYTCLCPPGWKGSNCDTERDECESSPCVNGGRCVDSFNRFECVCPMGYTGDRCEVNEDDCLPGTCQNGGSCVDLVNAFRCKCVPGFMGTLCQHNIDDCNQRPCANGGTCFDLVNDYKCFCRPGFEGKDCSVDINECATQPCRNGGSCEDLVADYICHCPPCSRGKNCEIHDDDCRYDSTFKPQLKLLTTVIPSSTIQPPYEFGVANNNQPNTMRREQTGGSKSTGTLDLGIVLSAVAVGAIAVIIPLLVVGLCCYFRRKNSKSDRPATTYISGPSVLDVEAHQQNLVNQAKMAQQQTRLVAVMSEEFYSVVPKKLNNTERYAKAKSLESDATIQHEQMPNFTQNNLYRPGAEEKVYCQLPSPLRKCHVDRSSRSDKTPTDSGLNSPESDICGLADSLDVRQVQKPLGRDISIDSAISCDSHKSPVRLQYQSDLPSSRRLTTDFTSKLSGSSGLGTNV